MEKTFTNATILSATVLAAFMIMIPVNHLSAQNEIHIDENVKMHKATVKNLDEQAGTFTAELEGSLRVPVYTDASTTVYLADGDEATLSSLKSGQNVYVFGKYNQETQSIVTGKIVIRNKRITERTTLSRSELQSSSRLLTSPLEILGLTAK